LAAQARAAWCERPTRSTEAAKRELLAAAAALLPEDDQGEGFQFPKQLRGELGRWVKSPPFERPPRHGQLLQLHPFLLAALAPAHPAAAAIQAALTRAPTLLDELCAVFSFANPAHHARPPARDDGAPDTQPDNADLGRLDTALGHLRSALLACFPDPPAGTVAASPPPPQAPDPSVFDDLSF
jgi:hypothetical protein